MAMNDEVLNDIHRHVLSMETRQSAFLDSVMRLVPASVSANADIAEGLRNLLDETQANGDLLQQVLMAMTAEADTSPLTELVTTLRRIDANIVVILERVNRIAASHR